MNRYLRLLVLLAFLAANIVGTSYTQAQDDEAEVYNQRLLYINTHPGKTQEWRQLLRDVSMKVAQKQADSGEILSWTVLRSVYPAGEEARSDFLISIISAGSPKSRTNSFADDMKSAGVKMTSGEYYEKRNALSSLVASELWQPRIYNGTAATGNYISLNMMKVKDWDTLGKTTSMWSPISNELINRGALSGWVFASKTFPTGSDTTYAAYSANIYPDFESAFGSNRMGEVFAKVHPGKDIDNYRSMLGKARSIANQELWTIVERITKAE